MLKVAIIIGSTRPGRKAEAVARWAYDIARKRTDAEFEVVDIASFNLPLLDEPMPPMFGQYSHDHTKAWSAKIASFDGFIFVTPEYNHATSGALKNAIDFLYNEWVNKAAGFIGYGATSGARAVENLRLIERSSVPGLRGEFVRDRRRYRGRRGHEGLVMAKRRERKAT